jgi:hypothetical protein
MASHKSRDSFHAERIWDLMLGHGYAPLYPTGTDQ